MPPVEEGINFFSNNAVFFLHSHNLFQDFLYVLIDQPPQTEGASRYPQEKEENTKSKKENTFSLGFMEGLEKDDREDEEEDQDDDDTSSPSTKGGKG